MRYTTEAVRTLDMAKSLSMSWGHNYIGSDHLALALLASPDSEAVRALKRLRVPIVELRRVLKSMLPTRAKPSTNCRQMSPRLNQLLGRAATLARERDSGPVGTEDLLMALIQSEGPTREQIVSAIIAASGDSAYSCCIAADLLRAIGDVFRDRETYTTPP